jgi:glycosyltransferase involved in cell wall biosynthesis
MSKVSIVVPVYNTEKYLDRCVQSLVVQSYQAIEIILVNDGSSDGSLDIINQWKERDGRIICVDQKNQGVSAARKNGTRVAKGEWVCYVDSDDEIPQNAIEKMVAASENVDVVIGTVDAQDFGNMWKFSGFNADYSRTEYLKKLLWNRQIHWGPVAKLFRKDLLDEFVFDIPRKITNGEDRLFNIRVACKVKNVRIINSIVYRYVLRTGSATFNDPYRSISYCWNFVKEYWRSFSSLTGYSWCVCFLTLMRFVCYKLKYIFFTNTLWRVVDKEKLKRTLQKFGFRKK